MFERDPDPLQSHYRETSRRRSRRTRRRNRRARLIPMCGLTVRHPTGEHPDVAIKKPSDLKRKHHLRPRHWGSKNIRWQTNKWIKQNGAFGGQDE
jgi:hypothetical protein